MAKMTIMNFENDWQQSIIVYNVWVRDIFTSLIFHVPPRLDYVIFCKLCNHNYYSQLLLYQMRFGYVNVANIMGEDGLITNKGTG